jgi:hypothetical protein
VLTEWMQDLSDALGIDLPSAGAAGDGEPAGDHEPAGDPELVDLILDLARDAAHAVDRPAAPLTTFLVGYAAAQRGGGRAGLAESAVVARDLAAAWERRSYADQPSDEPGDQHQDEHRPTGGTTED